MTNSVEPEKPFGRELATTSSLHLPLSQTQTRTQSQSQSPSVLFPLFVLYLGNANIVPLSTGRRAASKIKFQLQRCVYATQFFHRQVVGPLAPSFRPGPDQIHHLHSACNSPYLPSQFRLFVVGPGLKLLACLFVVFIDGRNCNVLISPPQSICNICI